MASVPARPVIAQSLPRVTDFTSTTTWPLKRDHAATKSGATLAGAATGFSPSSGTAAARNTPNTP
ncbi:MAG: hypothetical protein WDM96_11885 [Lacunisphaera sp.]